MSVVCSEAYNGRNVKDGVNKSAIIKYVITGTDDEATVLSTLASTAPTTWTIGGESVPRQTREVEQLHDDIWIGNVGYSYTNRNNRETGESVFQFNTGGGSQLITQSISTINRYVASGTAPSFKGAIGVSDNNVEGTTIIIPRYDFSEVHYIAASTVNDTYKLTLAGLTGKVNNATFKGFSAGEVLFLGASGSMRAKGDWEITFSFSQSPNITGKTIGDITGIAKKGWEYLWVRYKESTDQNTLVKIPASVHIEQVYEEGDFSGLGI